jgi:hypothetical protein
MMRLRAGRIIPPGPGFIIKEGRESRVSGFVIQV